MKQFIVLAVLIACAYAAPGIGHVPAVAVAPVAVAHAVPVATSYQNTYRAPVVKVAPVVATVHATPVVATHTIVKTAPLVAAVHNPVIHHAPVVHHAPVIAHAAVPVAHAVPVATSYAHTYGYKTAVAPVIKTAPILIH